jgi:hypothetical protein
MSSRLRMPATTRFDIGQDTKAGCGSTTTTSTAPSEKSRTYRAAVAPP